MSTWLVGEDGEDDVCRVGICVDVCGCAIFDYLLPSLLLLL